jgi:hypothetical protein
VPLNEQYQSRHEEISSNVVRNSGSTENWSAGGSHGEDLALGAAMDVGFAFEQVRRERMARRAGSARIRYDVCNETPVLSWAAKSTLEYFSYFGFRYDANSEAGKSAA